LRPRYGRACQSRCRRRPTCMDVSGSPRATVLRCTPGRATGNQSWSYQPGTGQLTDAAACLDLPGGNDATGLSYRSMTVTGRTTRSGGDGQRLRKPGTNKCVEVSGGSKANGAKVQLWDCNRENQKWLMVGPGPNPQGPGSQRTVGLAWPRCWCRQATERSDPGRGGVPAGKVWHAWDPLKRGRDRAEQTGEWLGTY
jgi:hypothetical protein